MSAPLTASRLASLARRAAHLHLHAPRDVAIRSFCTTHAPSAQASSSQGAETPRAPDGTYHADAEAVHQADASRDFSALLTDREKKATIDRMLRVDHAGELGASQIYAGQLAVFGGTSTGTVIAHMAAQERAHLAAFERLVATRRARPTALLPVWHVAGYALGLGTALLGKEAAMACTVAVEDVIAAHYNEQVRELLDHDDEARLRHLFRTFRDEELEHKDTGIEYDAERAPFYRALSNVIKTGCRAAIYVSERV